MDPSSPANSWSAAPWSSGLTGNTESLGDGLVLVLTILFWSVALDAVVYRWPRLGTP